MDETHTQERGVYHKSIHGGKWFLFGNILQKIMGVIPFLILARILLPEDYGVITVVFTVTSFLDRLATPGFGTALLQKKGSVEEYLDIVWTYDLVKSVGIGALIFMSGDLASSFFHVSGSYELIIRLSGLFPILTALSNSRQIYFFKELHFRKVFIRDIAAQGAYIIVALSFALFVHASAWALFLGYVGRYIVGMIMSYVLYPAIPRLSFKFGKLRDLMEYGKWIYGQNLLEYVLGFLDTIFIGRLLGQRELGLYSRARDLPTTISWPLLNIMNKIAFSAYAKIQDELDKVQQGLLKSLDVLLFAMVPFSLLLVLEGGSIVTVLLGKNWLSIVLPLKILAVGNIWFALITMLKPIFNAIGKPEIHFRLTLFQLVLSPPLIVLGIHLHALPGAALGVSLMWLCLSLYAIAKARPIFRIGLDRLWPLTTSLLTGSIATGLVALLFREQAHAFLPGAWVLLWVIFLGGLFTAISLFVSFRMKEGPWYTLRSIWGELKVRE